MTVGMRVLSCVIVGVATASCGGSPAATSKPPATGGALAMASEPPEPPAPALHTGAVTLHDGGTLPARVLSHRVDKDLELIRLELTHDGCEQPTIALGAGRGRGLAAGWSSPMARTRATRWSRGRRIKPASRSPATRSAPGP